jgi:UPF0755 protein
MRLAFRAIAVLLVGLAIVGGGYLYWAWHHSLLPGSEEYLVKPGTPLRALARELSVRGVLPEPYSLIALAYLRGQSRLLKAGEYRFTNGMTASELLDQVVAGRVIEYPLVLVEGWNFEQVRRAIAAAPKLVHTLEGLPAEEVMRKLGYPTLHPEGRFFPDTYYYSAGHTDVAVLQRAFERMRARLVQEWERRASDLPYRSMDEALVMASIVEKETGRPDERTLIAGVFVNRLRKGMRLQTDPTVIYGLGAGYDGNIRAKDLRRDTPYNTYTRSGLPPTPIAMPGGEALAAAMRPAQTDALYFVSRGDGSHVFSATLKEHNAAVIKYQLKGAIRPFSSSPRPGGSARPRGTR